MAEQVERLIRLSNALLFLSRSDQNELAWNPGLVDLSGLLEVIFEQIQFLAAEKKLEVYAELPGPIPIHADRDHLTRLFLNLLDNAVKYTPPGGQIALRAVTRPGEVQITIHNSGQGIASEHLAQLFDRFYRVDGHGSSETGRARLGLAIAQEIVRLHGGKISVQSAPGQGVTFQIDLPGCLMDRTLTSADKR